MTFTKEQAQKGARAAAKARTASQHQRMVMSAQIHDLVAHVPTEDLPTLFTDSAAQVVKDLAAGGTPEVESTADYLRMVEAADKLHKMGRLAAGQSTSNAATLHVDASMMSALEDKVARLRSQGAQDVESSRPTQSDENA